VPPRPGRLPARAACRATTKHIYATAIYHIRHIRHTHLHRMTRMLSTPARTSHARLSLLVLSLLSLSHICDIRHHHMHMRGPEPRGSLDAPDVYPIYREIAREYRVLCLGTPPPSHPLIQATPPLSQPLARVCPLLEQVHLVRAACTQSLPMGPDSRMSNPQSTRTTP
jgi:hypothetical protein